jgi:cytochrome P450
MKRANDTTSFLSTEASQETCPIEHNISSYQRKTAPPEDRSGPAIERDAAGTWHIRSFELTRTILRGSNTIQAGFGAEMMQHVGLKMHRPILYIEGQEHHQQRKQTARFFTPKAVSTNYRTLMERLSDKMVAQLQRTRTVNLSDLTLEMSVQVVGEVVGLTNSLLPGMPKRLDAFFDDGSAIKQKQIQAIWRFFHSRLPLLFFFFLDVKPAIRAHRKQKQNDVISHLLEQKRNDVEILTECLTFASAGMATTREFISVALWHLLEQPELRTRYVAGSEAERYAILGEILRLEPVIGHLYRRAAEDITIEYESETYKIAQGELIDLHLRDTNADMEITGEHPLEICPGRTLPNERISAELMSFGDGHHRCPGSYVAFQETDILLLRLLALESMHILKQPDLSWNDLVAGYELRKFVVAL